MSSYADSSGPADPALTEKNVPAADSAVQKNIGEGKTVVLVDDDPTTSSLVKNILKDYGFEVIEAVDGKDAWLKLKPEIKPCLIICDVIMPQMDGFSLFKQLRQNKETEKIPVLIISSRKAMADTFLSIGADEFLPKPIDTPKFLAVVTLLSIRGHAEILKDSNKSQPAAEDKTRI